MKNLLLGLTLFSQFAVASPIKFAAQVVTFAPTNTAEVGRAFLGIRCLREASSWEDLINISKTLACTNFKVNGIKMGKYQYEKAIEMKKIGPNQFQLDKTDISFSAARKGHTCIRVLTTLEAGAYANPTDEWSLLGFCTVKKLPFPDDAEIYDNRRVVTLNDFKNALIRPIVIETKP